MQFQNLAFRLVDCILLILGETTGNYHVMSSFGVITYIYSLLIDKDICDCQNVSCNLPCVYLCFSSGDLFAFSVRVSNF